MKLRTTATRAALIAALTATGWGTLAMASEPADLVIATPNIPVHLDPANLNRNVNWRFTHNVLESLIQYDAETGAFEPGLATAWEAISPTVLELTIREGVQCHNGEPFTAEDVAIVFGSERLLDEDAPGHAVGKLQFFPHLSAVEAIDDTTVRMTTEIPDPLLPLRLSTSVAAVPCGDAYLAADNWEAWGASIIGTGPYMLESFRPGEINSFTAFDGYWGEKPPYDSFTFRVVPEVGARVAGLIAGDFHIITEVTPDHFASIQGGGAAVAGGPINNIRMIVYDQNHPALRDPRVRRAMSLAIDRELIVETIFQGRTDLPNGLQMPSFGPMYVDEHKPTGFDPDLARALLEEAGYDGEEISYRYMTDYYTGEVLTAQILQQMWQDVGLNIRLELKENWAEITGADAHEGRGVMNYSATAVYPDPEGQLYRLFGPRGPFQNNGIWANSRFNEWGADLASTDLDIRRAAFARMLEIYESDAPSTYLHVLPTFLGVGQALKWEAGNTHFMDFRATAQ